MMDDQAKYSDPEEMITCPYNSAHSVLRKRLGFHLEKCRKSFPELAKEFKVCRYNNNHRIPCREYEYHLETCNNREVYYNNKFHIGDSENDIVTVLNENVTKPLDIPKCEENWDEVAENKKPNILDDIQTVAKQRPLLQNHSNEPPSVRKAKRNESRKQFRKFLNMEQINAVGSGTASASVVNPNSFELNDSKLGSSNDDDLESTSSWKTVGTATTQQTDISYDTALSSTIERLHKFQLGEGKKKIGRGSGKVTLNPSIQAGIGRGRRLQLETELPKQNPPNEFQEQRHQKKKNAKKL